MRGGTSIRRLLILAAALASTTAPALAHPHIFIDARATIVFDASGAVSGIRHSWTFDEEFSAWSVQGLDTDGDGQVSTTETQELADQSLQGLSEYQFYTYAGEGESNLTFVKGSGATQTFENGRTTLTFDIAAQPAHQIGERLEIAINDPEYYVAITFGEASAITLENAPAGCAASLEPPRELAPELAEQLYALGPDVTELPPALSQALRGVQGAIVVTCPTRVAAAPATALQAANLLAEARPTPFGGPPAEPGLPVPRVGILGWIAELQQSFYSGLSDALGRLKTDGNAFWVLGTLSFLYGVLHAAGPGHGKVVISSYVLANERQLRRGVFLSFVSAMLQSAVAVAFVLALVGLLQLTSTAMSEAANWLGIASYALIAALGGWLIVRKLFFPHRNKVEHHHHDDHHHDGDHHAHKPHGHAHIIGPEELGGNWREQLAVVLAVGLRPCSGALLVLVFAWSQGLMPAGIAAVFLMGLGTALTVAVLATIAAGAKGAALRLAGPGGGTAAIALWWLELLGAVAVLTFGILFLLASV